MANTTIPQKQKNSPKQKTIHETTIINARKVRQDRSAPTRERTASVQASRVTKQARAQTTNREVERVQNHSTSRQTVQAIGWVSRPISAQIDRRAGDLGITRSKSIAELIERGLKNDIFTEYEEIITKTIKEAITTELHKRLKWHEANQIQTLYYTAQVRSLVTNTLYLLFDQDQEALQQIVTESQDQAKQLMTNMPIQITHLIQEVAALRKKIEETRK